MKITRLTIGNLGLAVFFVYCLFTDMIDAKIGTTVRLILWAFILVLLFTGTLPHLKLKRSDLLAVAAILAFVVVNNVGLKNGSYMTTVKFVFFLIMTFVIRYTYTFPNKAVRLIATLGFIHVAATYLFFIEPGLYSIMYRYWGYYPSGTGRGTAGYKAALSDHYSGNGIVIAITYIALFSIYMASEGVLPKKKRQQQFLIFVLAVIGVVLTTKRAHLLFGVAAIVFVYYFCNPTRIRSRTFKLLMAALIAIPALYVLSDRIPFLREALVRFRDIDEDSHMLNRFAMWNHAIEMFKSKPLFGNGWMSFRYDYSIFFYTGRRNESMYINAHNVYIQLLAEVGIAGFLLYMGIMLYMIKNAFGLIRQYNRIGYKNRLVMTPLYFSASFLVFYLLYSFTGNCLYDSAEPYIFVVCGIILGSRDLYREMLRRKMLTV